MVVAASSNLLPSSGSMLKTDISPPIAAIPATEMQHAIESRASVRLSARKANWNMARLARANASTAADVWMKSCQVKVLPYGSGHPGVHVTCDANRKNPLASASDRAGRHQRSNGTLVRMPVVDAAINRPPSDTITSAHWNHVDDGMPGAPRALTYTSRPTEMRATQMMASAAKTSRLPALEAATTAALGNAVVRTSAS